MRRDGKQIVLRAYECSGAPVEGLSGHGPLRQMLTRRPIARTPRQPSVLSVYGGEALLLVFAFSIEERSV
jgi:hypothetical protein